MQRFGPAVVLLAVLMAAPSFGDFAKSRGGPGGASAPVGYCATVMPWGHRGLFRGPLNREYKLEITYVDNQIVENYKIPNPVDSTKDLQVTVEANFYSPDPGPLVFINEERKKGHKRYKQQQKMAPKESGIKPLVTVADGTSPYPGTIWENLYNIKPEDHKLESGKNYIVTAEYPGATSAPPVHFSTK
jgi:hypothetical protein